MLTPEELDELKPGDEIEFKAATRDSNRKAVRKVTGFRVGGVTVTKYAGWSDFVVHNREIIRVVSKVDE